MNTAHLCTRISELAYDDNPRPGLLSLGFDLVRAYDRGGTQAILATDYADVVLAFRGTEEPRDLFRDLRYIKTDFPGGGRVHRGFYSAFLEVWDEIAADLKNLAYPKIYTGHSLGAALAVMAAVMAPPREVHVYGCPRVGNRAFTDRLKCPVFRYENWFDLVTYVPPATSPVQAVHAWAHGRAPTLYHHPRTKVATPALGHFIRRYVKATVKLDR